MKLMIFLTIFCQTLISKPYIIGISGASGSGKSTLANEFLELMPDNVCIIRQDSYYKDLSHIPADKRRRQNFDIPNAIDFQTLEKNIAIIKKGNCIYEPVYDFKTNTRSKETTKLDSKSIIILEGTLVFTCKKIRKLLDLMIFVDTPLDLCLCRRIARDIKDRDISFKQSQTQYQSQVRPMYFKHILPCKDYAHLVIPNHQVDKNSRKNIAKTLLSKLK